MSVLRVIHLIAEDDIIFHVLGIEVKYVFDCLIRSPEQKYAVLISPAFKGKWKHRFLQALLPVYFNFEDLCEPFSVVEIGPEQLNPGSRDSWIVNPHEFVDYAPSVCYRSMVERVKAYYSLREGESSRFVMVQRKKDRILFEKSGSLLEDWLSTRLSSENIDFSMVSFEDLDPIDQWRSLMNARVVLAVHGSGLTNLVFSPLNCAIVEIDFRKFWTCDPLCDEHRNGQKKPGEVCGIMPQYHKADYHNLSHLFGRDYYSLSAVSIEGYSGANPISVARVYVDGEGILNEIKFLMRTKVF